MRYINEEHPNIRVLIRRGPELAKGQNPNTRQDEFVQFRFGMAETDDAEAIAVLDARSDCVREADRGKVAGYIREADIEAEVQRRLAEREQTQRMASGPVASANPSALEPPPPGMSTVETRNCPECGKSMKGRLAYQNHMKTHKKIAAAG